MGVAAEECVAVVTASSVELRVRTKRGTACRAPDETTTTGFERLVGLGEGVFVGAGAVD